LLNHRVGQSALQYILGRGISRQSLATFKLGYAPEAGNGLLRFLAEKKNYSLEDLEKAGLIMRRTEDRGQKTDYYDRFRNRLMFPLADHRGNVCGFSGRSLPGAPGDAPKYINTPETLIYHKSDLLYGLSVTKEAIRKEDTAVIVEGELDTISSFQAGVQNVVAIKGSALTESQAGLLKRFGENLVLALDMDIAGDAAARRGIEIADSAGFNIKIAILGEYKDPDEAAQKDPEFFKKRIKGAVGVFDFLIDSAFRRFGGETAEEKKKIGQELGPILAKISDEIMKAHYVKELAKRLAVEEEAVWEKVKQLRVAGYELRVTSPVAQAKINKSRREILEDYLLAILFQVGGKILKEGTEKAEPFIKIPANKRILEILADYFRQKKEFELVEFAKILPAELGEIFSQFCLTDLRGLPQAEKEREREIERTINKLERLSLQERLEEISEEMGKLEKAPAFAEATAGKEIEKLEREFKELSEQLK
jgi:DNA primase